MTFPPIAAWIGILKARAESSTVRGTDERPCSVPRDQVLEPLAHMPLPRLGWAQNKRTSHSLRASLVPPFRKAYLGLGTKETRKMPARPHEKVDVEAAAEPLDPQFVERCRESLADPRPDIPAAQVRAHLKALHEERSKRGA